jgi:hypothetical protein
VSSFGWLLDLLPAATPAPKGVAPGVAESADMHGRTATTADEVPHPPHLPHRENSSPVNDADWLDDLAEHLTERAAILQFDAGLDRAQADVAAVRIVQCSTCVHWSADPLGGGGIGKCATGADAESWSAHDPRPLSPWPDAPRHCAGWEGASRGQ